MRVLVLGGNGFIGSHLVDVLVAGGARVRILDRAGSLKSESLASVEYRFGNFLDIAFLAESLADVDLVVHLISTTVPGTANLDPVGDIEGNVVGSVKLLQQMREVGVSRLLFLSSGGTVYGDTRVLPIPEGHERNPISSYGLVKVAIENYIAMFGSLYGLRSLVLRVSNPYGPRQTHIGVQGVIPTFFRRIMEGEKIKIWGDGSSVRDYLYISDLIAFMASAIREDLAGVFNVGSGQGRSVLEILKVVSEVSGCSPRVEHVVERGFDVRNVVLDISKAKKSLNWLPVVSLRSGCEKYWRWLNEN